MKIGLDIGVGTNRSYKFKPKLSVEYHPIFVDIEEPTREIRNVGDWVIADANLNKEQGAKYLPFRDGTFDKVVASHIIEHLDNPDYFIKELYRILKGSGTLDLYCPNFISKASKLDPTHKHVFNPISIVKKLKRVGFRVYFPYRAGSKIPNFLRKPLTIILNLLSDEICVRAIKYETN